MQYNRLTATAYKKLDKQNYKQSELAKWFFQGKDKHNDVVGMISLEIKNCQMAAMNTAVCVFQIETTTYGALAGSISWERRYASPAVALGNIFQGLYLPINLSFQRRRSYISKDTLSSEWQLSSYYLKDEA